MISQLTVARSALRLAPEPFAAELAQWIEWGEPPDNDLLTAILKNDLQATIVYTGGWALVQATLRWLWNFGPSGSYGSAEAVRAWQGQGGLKGKQ